MLVQWLMYTNDMMYRWRIWLRGKLLNPLGSEACPMTYVVDVMYRWRVWLRGESCWTLRCTLFPLVTPYLLFGTWTSLKLAFGTTAELFPQQPDPQLSVYVAPLPWSLTASLWDWSVNSKDPRGPAICTSGKKSPSQPDFSFWFPLPRGQKCNSALGRGWPWALIRDRGLLPPALSSRHACCTRDISWETSPQ